MEDNIFTKVHKLGQSFWLDFISKNVLDNGDLEKLIQEGAISGLTSNPVIFENAISKTEDYDGSIKELKSHNVLSKELLYENLAIKDIQRAADLFLPVYQKTKGQDGFVSLEVSPKLAHDHKQTVQEAKRLHKSVNRKNLMIKVPATKEGIKAIYTLTALGMNINVTLLFSVDQYILAAKAYLEGLRQRVKDNLDITGIHSVASFFLSRIDTKVDTLLEEIIANEADDRKKLLAKNLLGKIAISNAKKAYLASKNLYDKPQNAELMKKGANPQRLLWASTGTKNKAYSDILYVQSLIGPNTVNTLPPKTLEAFKDHGQARCTLLDKCDDLSEVFDNLQKLKINLEEVSQELLVEGVEIFATAYDNLLLAIEEKSTALEKKN